MFGLVVLLMLGSAASSPVERPEPPEELYDAPSAEYAPEDLFGLNIPLSGIDSDPLFSGNLWASARITAPNTKRYVIS